MCLDIGGSGLLPRVLVHEIRVRALVNYTTFFTQKVEKNKVVFSRILMGGSFL